MIQKITHTCQGTCSRQIDIEIEDGIVRRVSFTGGCHGNTRGVAALVCGMEVREVIRRLEGNPSLFGCRDNQRLTHFGNTGLFFLFGQLGLHRQPCSSEIGCKVTFFRAENNAVCFHAHVRHFHHATAGIVVYFQHITYICTFLVGFDMQIYN